MIDRRLRQLAEDFASVPADQFEDLAQVCRETSVNQVDTRYFVLAECFNLTRGFFTEGDVGFVGPRFWQSVIRIWGDYLSAILDAELVTEPRRKIQVDKDLTPDGATATLARQPPR
jgi:hypothetical protein